ncbi:Uncharacterised protein [Serratia fonticola]|jgi:hypothetical protein|nr:Uncharacterised protein [Serratia fonticola]
MGCIDKVGKLSFITVLPQASVVRYQVRLFSLGSQNAKFVLEASQVPPYHKDLALDFT